MATKTKLSIDFDAFTEYAKKLEKVGADIKKITEECLTEAAEYVTDNLEKDIKPHKRTRRTEKSLRKNSKVTWQGTTASIDVGFDIAEGGLASIFLMKGTPRHEPNHPGTKQDKRLYNDVYGAATQKKIQEMQEKHLQEALEKIMGK